MKLILLLVMYVAIFFTAGFFAGRNYELKHKDQVNGITLLPPELFLNSDSTKLTITYSSVDSFGLTERSLVCTNDNMFYYGAKGYKHYLGRCENIPKWYPELSPQMRDSLFRLKKFVYYHYQQRDTTNWN